MSQYIDLSGTTNSNLQIEKGGVKLKNDSSNLKIRNSSDSADSEITTSKANISGDSIDLNSDAAGSGSDWKYTISRPSSGMTADVSITLPIDDGTPNQVLQTDGSGNLSWVNAGSTASSLKLKTTTIAFGSTSPVAMFTTGASDIIDSIDVVIDTAFDGTPSLSVGITGTTSKYLGATQVDLTAAAKTIFTVRPGFEAQGAESLIATYSAGSATTGSARIIVKYATPA